MKLTIINRQHSYAPHFHAIRIQNISSVSVSVSVSVSEIHQPPTLIKHGENAMTNRWRTNETENN